MAGYRVPLRRSTSLTNSCYTFGFDQPCLSNSLEALGEPDPGAAGPRAARARPHHPAAAGQVSAEVRGGHQPGRRAERRRRHRPVGGVSRRGAAVARIAADELQAVVEVETGESVNHLEALAQWAHFAKLRAAFHLYVPAGMVDVARRLCEDNQIHVTEIWSYHTVGDRCASRWCTAAARRRRRVPKAPRRSEASRSAPVKAGSEARQAAKKPAKKPAAKKAAPKKAASEEDDAEDEEVIGFPAFHRDKRGYEHFYLVETSTNRRGKTRARVLYWFRTPPDVKVGREPFDDARSAARSKRRIPTSCSTGARFAETPIPSADAERWRERRRAREAPSARGVVK